MGIVSMFKSCVSRRVVLLFSFLFVGLLVFSLFTCVFVEGSYGASLDNFVRVGNELELRNAINNARGRTTIALNNAIVLTETLAIPASKNIILTSYDDTKFFKLIGACDQTTININNRGVLTIDTHLTKEAF